MHTLQRLSNDCVYRLRAMDAIIAQIECDKAELSQLVQKAASGKLHDELIENIQQRLVWLQSGVREFNRLDSHGIEGVLWRNSSKIEEDIETVKKLYSWSNNYF